MSVTRKELRQKTADRVNKLTKPEMISLGISRVGDITDMDNIGIPVYNAVRPLSSTIAMHSGKGIDKESARAGAILEAIEYEVASHPSGEWIYAPASDIPPAERLQLEDCFPVRASMVNDLMPLAWEKVTNIQDGRSKLVPSDLVWMVRRAEDPIHHFQSGSNGLASGGSLQDAILSGLYELLERDAWSINTFLSDRYGVMPPRTPLISMPDKVAECVRKIESANCKLHLCDVTTDYQIPAFMAFLLDMSGNVAGTFSGYGCHLDAGVAALRAVTEAAQSRCVYISGARDDLFRRQFLLMKRMDQLKLDEMFSSHTVLSPNLSEYRRIEFPDVKTELRYLLKLIRSLGVSEVYVRELGAVLDGAVHVVRVISPQCEPVRLDQWAPGFRCISYCNRKMQELSKVAAKELLEEETDPSESWKHEQ